MASKGDEETRAKPGSSRKREGDATRISLLDSFIEWKSQKADTEAQLRRIKEAALGTEVHFKYMKTTMTHGEFASHLLVNHRSSCYCCREGLSPYQQSTGQLPANVSVATATVYTQTEHSEESTAPVLQPASETLSLPATYQRQESTPMKIEKPLGCRSTTSHLSVSPIKPPEETPSGYDDGDDDVMMTSDEEDNLIHYQPQTVTPCDEDPNSRIINLNETAESEAFAIGEEDQTEMDMDESIGDEGGEKDDINEAKCIVSLSKILSLLRNVHGFTCQQNGCKKPLYYETNPIGTAVIFSWQCGNGHKGTWYSQSRYCNMFTGNIHFASSITVTGNNFSKIALYFKSCKIYFVSPTTFYRIQRLYVAPAVRAFWHTMQEEELTSLQGKPLCLAGDGRTDSPGHSAQYLTYSFMETESSKILHLEVVDVREVGGKSPNMEKIGFERGLDYLNKKVNVGQVVTDAHVQIVALMKNCPKYSDLSHQIDVWHGAKNLVKKLASVAQQKGNSDLLPWIPAVRNHFWYCSHMCMGNETKFKTLWLSLLHHVLNEHEWLLNFDGTPGKCEHADLSDSEHMKPWLVKGSKPHAALKSVIVNKQFLSKLKYYKDFKHTGNLESFHNQMLMYASKRCSYSYLGYVTRMLMAAIDHNYHSDRPYEHKADGKPVHRANFSKRSKTWAPQQVKVAKGYGYIPSLLRACFEMRKDTPGHLSQNVVLPNNDPRRIQANIAMVPRPSMETLLKEHQSRLDP